MLETCSVIVDEHEEDIDDDSEDDIDRDNIDNKLEQGVSCNEQEHSIKLDVVITCKGDSGNDS